MTVQTTKQWHIAPWHPLAWVETGLKAIAIVVGIIALFGALGSGQLGDSGRLAAGAVACNHPVVDTLFIGAGRPLWRERHLGDGFRHLQRAWSLGHRLSRNAAGR